MKLFDTKTGKPVEVPDDQVAGKMSSGVASLPKGTAVPVVGSDGTVGHVPAEYAAEEFANGARVASPKEIRDAEMQAKYGGAAGMAAAAGEGAVRGLTAGVSDAAAVYGTKLFGGEAASQAVREHLQGIKEANPITSMVGEVAGMAAPLVLSGGAAAPLEAASLARTGVEGASMLGRGAETAGLLGKGGTVLADGAVAAGEAMVPHVIPAAAKAAAEGIPAAAEAVSGVGRVRGAASAVADVLGAPLNAISKAGTWAERGAGALLGESAESLGARIAQKAAAKGFQGATEAALFGAANEIDESVLGDTKLSGEKLLVAAGHAALFGGVLGAAAGGIGELGHEVVGRMAPMLEREAGENAIRAITPRKAFTEKIEGVAGGRAALGDDILNKVGIEAGDTVKTIQPKIEEHFTRTIEDLTSHVDSVANAQIPLVDIVKALGAKATALDGVLGKEAAAATIRKQVDNIARIYGALGEDGLLDYEKVMNTKVALGDLLKQRRSLESTIEWNNGKVTNEGLKTSGRTLEDVIMQHGEEVAKAQGGTWAKVYQDKKDAVSRAYLLRDIADDSVARMNTNAGHSLTDKIFGSAVAAAGLTHGPLGAAAGWAAMNASTQIRTKGRSTTAVLLNKLAAIGGVERAASRFDREVDRGVAAVFNPGARVSPKVKDKAFETAATAGKPGGSYAERVAAVASAVGNPEAHVEAARNAVSGIAAHAPGVANSFQSTAIRATTYLHSQIPQGHVNLSTLTPHVKSDGSDVPHYAKADFNRKFDVVNGGPVVVIDKLAKGTLTKGEVDAADHVYPEAMMELRQKIMAQLVDQKKALPVAKEAQLIQVLKLPRKGTILDPKFVATVQAIGEMQPAKPPAAPRHILGNAISSAVTLTGQSKI